MCVCARVFVAPTAVAIQTDLNEGGGRNISSPTQIFVLL